MFRVMYWDDQFETFPRTDKEHYEIQTHSSYEDLNVAKKVCRGLGHTGENNEGSKSYPPVAYVANSNYELVYNPRFKKSSPVGR